MYEIWTIHWWAFLYQALHTIDQMKALGFQQATAASISLGIDALLTGMASLRC